MGSSPSCTTKKSIFTTKKIQLSLMEKKTLDEKQHYVFYKKILDFMVFWEHVKKNP
jgi:hypothetical protein